ncbi:hypothetical protein SteCoe_26385 [Stentor coeruleus]|uniref:Uncharacterized protein n=1 Tax=Stentor coeruleus TaxID=5963 RepID=A0A1R2BCY7_9CILI|nr:hypothetical protein SteCoe_26385 [Stentor coeruleus]
MESNFDEILQESYDRTLKLAVNITQNKAILMNTNVTSNDLKFVKKIAKGCKEFQDLPERNKKKRKLLVKSLETPVMATIRSEKSAAMPRNFGKQKLSNFIEERNKYVSGSKAGKPIKYAEIGPNIMEKLRTSSSIYLEDTLRSSQIERPGLLPHISLRTGKLKDPIKLPSFKDYVSIERSKNPKDVAFDRINKCNKKLDDFSKELSGLETFITTNPGVIWNNDKKVLLRLHAHPGQKNLIIKAYNDQYDPTNLRTKISKKISSFEKEEINIKKDKFLSKTPNPQAMIDFFDVTKHKSNDNPENIVRRCYSRFRRAQESQDKRLVDILQSLDFTRPMNLRQKALHILNDNERFRDKSHSIVKMSQIQKKLDLEQERRLKKSKEQIVVYDQMMEFLKSKFPSPTDAEINFVEILREILEEGWYINEEIVKQILEIISDEDREDIQPLVDFLLYSLEDLSKHQRGLEKN